MAPYFVVNKDITNIFTCLTGGEVMAVTIYPFIIKCEEKISDELINHEKIHYYQFQETLVIGFPIIYLINLIINIFYYWDRNLAYRNTLFEREAYKNMNNLDYLQKRKIWAWLRN